MHTTLTGINGKNVPLLHTGLHALKVERGTKRLSMHTEAFQAVRQSHKKQSQQQLAMSLNQLSMLATVIHATAKVRTAM